MSLINHRAREIHVKIVYYGAGLGGKTTNVRMLHERLPADRRGRLVTIATEQERTLFFDFMPVELGLVNGFTTRFHLYTVPGQIFYRRSRRAVLQGVDGIVFVADSQPDRERDNVESLEDMHALLGQIGVSAAQLARLPRVIQYNKRDVTGAIPVERMRAVLNRGGLPEVEAVAIDGVGVRETMRAIAKGVLGRLTGLAVPAPAVAPAVGAAPVAATPAPVPPAPAVPQGSFGSAAVARPYPLPAMGYVPPIPVDPVRPGPALGSSSPRAAPAFRRKPLRRIVPTRG
jgi:signal recognition particle receptor subunit beta